MDVHTVCEHTYSTVNVHTQYSTYYVALVGFEPRLGLMCSTQATQRIGCFDFDTLRM